MDQIFPSILPIRIFYEVDLIDPVENLGESASKRIQDDTSELSLAPWTHLF